MADRYVFSIKSKTKWGIDVGVSFFTCYCLDDGKAVAIAEACNTYLPNYAKVVLSKVLMEAENYDIPNEGAVITDVNVVSWLLANKENPNRRRTIKIPLPFILQGDKSETPGRSDMAAVLCANVCDSEGNPLNSVISSTDAGKNIVQGGPVEETN